MNHRNRISRVCQGRLPSRPAAKIPFSPVGEKVAEGRMRGPASEQKPLRTPKAERPKSMAFLQPRSSTFMLSDGADWANDLLAHMARSPLRPDMTSTASGRGLYRAWHLVRNQPRTLSVSATCRCDVASGTRPTGVVVTKPRAGGATCGVPRGALGY